MKTWIIAISCAVVILLVLGITSSISTRNVRSSEVKLVTDSSVEKTLDSLSTELEWVKARDVWKSYIELNNLDIVNLTESDKNLKLPTLDKTYIEYQKELCDYAYNLVMTGVRGSADVKIDIISAEWVYGLLDLQVTETFGVGGFQTSSVTSRKTMIIETRKVNDKENN